MTRAGKWAATNRSSRSGVIRSCRSWWRRWDTRSPPLPSSRHPPASPEPRIVPRARTQHAPQREDGIEDIDVTHVERREPETQDVRRPEVTDDAVRDQPLHDRVAFGVGVADLAPAPLGIEGRDEPQPEPVALLLHEPSEESPQRDGLGAHQREIHSFEGLEAGVERGQREHGWGADHEPLDAGGRLVGRVEIERPSVAYPAGE